MLKTPCTTEYTEDTEEIFAENSVHSVCSVVSDFLC